MASTLSMVTQARRSASLPIQIHKQACGARSAQCRPNIAADGHILRDGHIMLGGGSHLGGGGNLDPWVMQQEHMHASSILPHSISLQLPTKLSMQRARLSKNLKTASQGNEWRALHSILEQQPFKTQSSCQQAALRQAPRPPRCRCHRQRRRPPPPAPGQHREALLACRHPLPAPRCCQRPHWPA